MLKQYFKMIGLVTLVYPLLYPATLALRNEALSKKIDIFYPA